MKRFVLLAVAMLAAVSACACASFAAPARIVPAEEEAVLPYDEAEAAPAPVHNDGFASLPIIRGVQSCGDGYIVYPKVLYCAHAQEINDSILEITAGRAEQVSASIFTKYRIEYNRSGIFSLRMELYDLYGDGSERLENIYMTYDMETGRLCAINDLFDRADERWRGVMPDIVTAQAAAKGITLLCDVMPIADGQQFFITKDEVVLVYELYEIATWSAGEPEFTIPIAQLSEFIPEDSPLAKVALAGKESAPAVLATDGAAHAPAAAEAAKVVETDSGGAMPAGAKERGTAAPDSKEQDFAFVSAAQSAREVSAP